MKDQKNGNDTILVLPSWYPSKMDAFAGDFIQRHVKAISLYNRQYVIYVIKDDQDKYAPGVTAKEMVFDNYTEKIIYYNVKKTGISLLDKLFSHMKYKRVYRDAINEYILLNGRPNIIHVHVAFKAGMMALWAKNKWNIPFVVTEHWTVYLKEADLRFEHFSILERRVIKKILKQASALMVVSDWLGKAIQKIGSPLQYSVIPNVVDHAIFFPVYKNPSPCIQFIHASTMNYQKNIECILRALSILKERKLDFVFKLFGPAPPSLIRLVDELNLNNKVLFKGEVAQDQLALEMQQSDALIHFSRFETFGCVLIEANACGLPVMVSDIPVFHELITENENGLFAKAGNHTALAEKIMEFVADRNKFDKMKIAAGTEKYGYPVIGKKFNELFKTIFK